MKHFIQQLRKLWFSAVVFGFFGFVSTAMAQDDAHVLTVTIAGEPRVFSIDDLRAIGEETFETTTIWTDGVQQFTGTPLRSFLAALDVSDGEMVATAINDYAISVPVPELLIDGPIIAFARNGAAMSIREKGPLWIVYPYDDHEEFQTEIVHARSIWQLNRIAFKAP